MVEVSYETEVLLKDSKNKLFSAVLYGRILVDGNEVCKIPLEVDTLTDAMYEATIDYDTFLKNWEIQRALSSKNYVEQLVRFYRNIEVLKEKTKEK